MTGRPHRIIPRSPHHAPCTDGVGGLPGRSERPSATLGRWRNHLTTSCRGAVGVYMGEGSGESLHTPVIRGSPQGSADRGVAPIPEAARAGLWSLAEDALNCGLLVTWEAWPDVSGNTDSRRRCA